MSLPRKKLLIDFDDTICSSVFLIKVNKFLGTNYKIEDFKNYLIDDVIPVDKRDLYFKTFYDTDPYAGIPLIKGAKQALKKLNTKYDIYICSGCVFEKSPNDSAKLFASKFNFLVKELPFLDPNKFIFTSSKDIVCADVMIDDYFHNLRNNIPQKLLFNSYHNKDIPDIKLAERNVVRVSSWKEICDILM